MTLNKSWFTQFPDYAVAICPVTGQWGFQNIRMTGSPIFSVNFTNRKNPAKPNYQMSIKKSQAILKCFIDLKSSVWFTWAQKTKPCSVTLQRELFSARLPLEVLKTLNDQQSLYRVHRKIRVNDKTKTNTLHRAKTLCISLAHTFPGVEMIKMRSL